MYTKYKSGVINYDVICTSDYMVEKMMQEGEAQKIDTSSMEYYKNIDEKYLDFCKAFDPTNEYAVPYLWGTVGILYNTKVIKEKVDSWSILWDKKYDDQIVMQNSMRDAFMVPLKWRHFLKHNQSKGIKTGTEPFIKQKPIVEAYLVDEARDAMVSGDALHGRHLFRRCYRCHGRKRRPRLQLSQKKALTSGLICFLIPKTAEHKEAAEKFIDY